MENSLNLIFIAFIIGISAGMVGIFYRNILKTPDLILNFIYPTLIRWRDGDNKFANFFGTLLSCPYCFTTWIAIFMYIGWYWNDILIWNTQLWIQHIIMFITSIGIQHIVVMIICKYLIPNHPDFDHNIYLYEEIKEAELQIGIYNAQKHIMEQYKKINKEKEENMKPKRKYKKKNEKLQINR